jgi:hypothetical protein
LTKYIVHLLILRNERYIFHRNAMKPYEYGPKPCAFGQAGQPPQKEVIGKYALHILILRSDIFALFPGH